MQALPTRRLLLVHRVLLAGCLLSSFPAAGRAQLARAESLLATGDAVQAVALLRRHTDRNERDVRSWILLGRAELASHPTSNLPRVRAINAFRRATSLEPTSAEAWSWYVRAGMEIGGADGERIVREGSEQLLRLDPGAAEAWSSWLLVFRNARDRARMRAILEPGVASAEVRARIARLLLEDERYDSANAILDGLLRDDPAQPAWLARRAQSGFESGDTLGGAALYDRAIQHAGRDPSVLWEHAIGVASPDEVRAWESGVPPDAAAAWFRSFWARRNPDLFRGVNGRLAEHFRRLRVARRTWPLTHPFIGASLRASTRSLQAGPSAAEEVFYQRCEARETPTAPASARDRLRLPLDGSFPLYGAQNEFIPWPGTLLLYSRGGRKPINTASFGRDLRDVDSTAASIGYNRRTGLDDRGLLYLRLGAPLQVTIGSTNSMDRFCAVPDLERWQYDELGTVRFFRPGILSVTGSADRQTGDIVLRPMNDGQMEATAAALTTDASSVRAVLEFGTWTAQFAASRGQTEIVTLTTAGEAAVALLSADGVERRESSVTGAVRLTAPPGAYEQLVHARDGDRLGRLARPLEVRALGRGLSDLLLSVPWSEAVSREAAVAHASRTLRLSAGQAFRLYAELYGLPPSGDRIRYRAAYAFLRSDAAPRDVRPGRWETATTITQDRVVPDTAGVVMEWVDVTPDRLTPGRYIVRLEITDLVAGAVLGRSSLAFVIE